MAKMNKSDRPETGRMYLFHNAGTIITHSAQKEKRNGEKNAAFCGAKGGKKKEPEIFAEFPTAAAPAGLSYVTGQKQTNAKGAHNGILQFPLGQKQRERQKHPEQHTDGAAAENDGGAAARCLCAVPAREHGKREVRPRTHPEHCTQSRGRLLRGRRPGPRG